MKPIDASKLGRYIRELRGNRTQEEMAQIAGMPLYTYRRLETGETDRITLEDAAKLARAFNLGLEQFAALAGVWAIPEMNTEENARINRLFETLRNEMARLEPDNVELLANLYINLARTVFQQEERRPKPEARQSELPEWFQKLQPRTLPRRGHLTT